MVANPEEEPKRYFLESIPKYKENKFREAFLKQDTFKPNFIWLKDKEDGK